MKILLDTQAFLWFINNSPQLSKKAKQLFVDANNELFLSLASIWEMAIKISLEKLQIKGPLETFIPLQLQENGIGLLDISFRHVTKVATLPFHHRDPFDRLLIAQGIEENIPILSYDEIFDSYNVVRFW